MEDSAWGRRGAEHNYYNNLPGKEPPRAGLVDSGCACTALCVGSSAPLARSASAHLCGEGPRAKSWGSTPSSSFCSPPP